MSTWLNVVMGISLGLVANEVGEVSPWLARRLVRWAAEIRYPGRAEEFEAVINDRPGKLFKLATAVGFACAALTYRLTRRRSALRWSTTGKALLWLGCSALAGVLFGVQATALSAEGELFVFMSATGAVMALPMLRVRLVRPLRGLALGFLLVGTVLSAVAVFGLNNTFLKLALVPASTFLSFVLLLMALRTASVGERLVVPFLVAGIVMISGVLAQPALTALPGDVQTLAFRIMIGLLAGVCVSVGWFVQEALTRKWFAPRMKLSPAHTPISPQ
ncbi:hypothetical protein AB0I60_07420 [Actinosynnema sp. NPDC050436]|uniref:hypothetical protein n=1 Tax=Actinosynnema sp. NPDC050436 TaxID=3155659 RepID=UPI0033C05E50